jgi:CRP/FNR family transcriptional regulator
VTIQPRVPFDSIPLLATLKADDRVALEPLCRMRGYEKGEVIFREGEPADRIHFVYAGRVKIVKAAGARDIIIEILGPGEPAGAVAAFERRPFPATAIALEPAGIVSIPEREFFDLLERRQEMTRSVLSGLTMRLMMVNKRLADMTGSAEARATRLFLTLAERMGTAREGGIFVPLALSRQDIADLLGTTLETAIRLMSRWQKEGMVMTEKDGFVVPDIAALRRIGQDGE